MTVSLCVSSATSILASLPPSLYLSLPPSFSEVFNMALIFSLFFSEVTLNHDHGPDVSLKVTLGK